MDASILRIALAPRYLLAETRHLRLRPTALLVALACSPAALAQQGDAGSPQERIVVVGSRIPQPDFVFSNPINSFGSDALQYAGTTTLMSFLQEVPALGNSIDLQTYANAGDRLAVGLNLLNLRNLGENRTLVLVNGRRHVAGSAGSAAVDINSIPVDLIERVDILTGGASALYGADGVSGVVNFVLKDNFEGITSRVQFGQPDDAGGDTTFVSVLGGHNFGGGRGNITASIELAASDAVNRDDRSYSRLGNGLYFVDNPDDLSDDPNVVDQIVTSNLRFVDTSPGGSIWSDLDYGVWGAFGAAPPSDESWGLDYTGDGQPFVVGQEVGSPYDAYVVGGSGSLRDQFNTQLLPEQDRSSISTNFHWDLSSSHTVFAEAKFAQSETKFQSQPTFDYLIPIELDNAFAPANAVAEAADFDNGLGVLEVARDNIDLGPVRKRIERDTTQLVLGFEGELPISGWTYEASYSWGETNEDNYEINNRIEERWLAATDAVFDPDTNEIVCRSDLDPDAWPLAYFYNYDPARPDFGLTFTPGPGSGCVPADIFGEDVSPEAAAWINTTSLRRARISQDVFSGFITGDSGSAFQLPGGPLEFAAGIEWREEKSEDLASDYEKLGANYGFDVTWLGQDQDAIGKFDVFEWFTEVNLPLLVDKPLVRELSVDAAFRRADYSTSGENDTYKAGLLWRLNDQVMFRSTRARAVRAPNISELFAPDTQTFKDLDDPCAAGNVDAGTGLRYDNCADALGFDPNTFDPGVNNYEGRIGGNPNLDPERADTVTYGIVLTPTAIGGLNFGIDFWQIKIKEAITFYEAQTILEKCYDLPSPNQFCPLIERDIDGYISSFQEFAANVAQFQTEGFDYTLQYMSPQLDAGQFAFSLVATRLDDLTFVDIEAAEPDYDVGEPGAPAWQAVLDLTWMFNDWTVNYGLSWAEKTDRFTRERLAADPDYVDPQYLRYAAREVHDIHVQYDLDTDFGLALFAGINNLTNQKPDRVTILGSDLGEYTYPVSPLGRNVYFGVRATFD